MGKGQKTQRKRKSEAEKKIQRFMKAKSMKVRANYATDLAFDVMHPDPVLDELCHFGVEMLLGRGPVDKRIVTWSKKFLKFRGFGLGRG